MKRLGIITTTYNRAYCIGQLYESLKKQKSTDFLWLIVDDGSQDDTKKVVTQFIDENCIEIKYVYQENKGMHGARNTAYNLIDTELNVIIDSDDWLADNIVEKILIFWDKTKKTNVSGIISLNADPQGNIIGDKLPNGLEYMTTTEMTDKYHIKGDKKFIFRSELTRLYPYPEFDKENFFPASYKFRLLDKDYTMANLNEVTCIVDYSENSMSFNKINQYRTCPKGFAFYRNEMIRLSNNPRYILKQNFHYIAESIFAKNSHFIRESSKPFYTIICLPVGILLYYYLKRTKRKLIKI